MAADGQAAMRQRRFGVELTQKDTINGDFET
jgi:hypothetical protein